MPCPHFCLLFIYTTMETTGLSRHHSRLIRGQHLITGTDCHGIAEIIMGLWARIRFYWFKQVLPKIIWEERVALAQLRNKVPIGYNSTPKLPFLLRRSPLQSTWIHQSLNHPKRHPDPISRFATVHFPDRQTDRHTHSVTSADFATRLFPNYFGQDLLFVSWNTYTI